MARYLLLLFYLGTARAACFGKDASFNPTLVGTKYPFFSGAQAWDIFYTNQACMVRLR
jgi:hypothetical protein